MLGLFAQKKKIERIDYYLLLAFLIWISVSPFVLPTMWLGAFCKGHSPCTTRLNVINVF